MEERLDVLYEYIEAVLKETLGPRGLTVSRTMNGRFCFLSVERPEVIRVTFPVGGGPEAFSRAHDDAMKAAEFIAGPLEEDLLLTEESVRAFFALPGKVSFLTEDRYGLYRRIALIAAQSRFGSRLVTGADIPSDRTLVLHSREGNYYVRLSDFRKNLAQTLDRMGHLMRKPIRPRFDKICKENRSEKK